ncbi:hypothetical protein D3C83_22120 [compost metagenome]
MTTPKAKAKLPLAPTISLSGNATDDRSVASVSVAIKNGTTNLWLRTDGTWGLFQWLPASLTTPGGTSSAWTFPWAPPGTGSFTLQVKATDAAGNIDPTKPSVPFTVIS